MVFRIPLPEIEREIITRSPDSLYQFIRLAWPHADPADFVDNWHLGALCERLQAVSAGQIKNLVVNVPPGTMKSLTISVFWPLWEWIFRPKTKWMFASFDSSLALRDANRMIRIIQTCWWENRWPVHLTEKRPAAASFENNEGGYRFSTSVGGRGTGRHCDIQVVDDPTKPRDTSGSRAVTMAALLTTSTWWKETMSTRRVDPETFRRLIVMQRLHEEDLAGEMLREGGWDHFCVPMRYTKETCVCGKACTPEDPRTKEGELLWPRRFSEEVVQRDERVNMGPMVAAAQLQQRPTPQGGGIIKNDWFRYWHTEPNTPAPKDPRFPTPQKVCAVLPKVGIWIQSWDMTFKKSEGADYVAGGVWLYKAPNAYLVYQVCERMSFVEACAAVVDVTNRYPQAHTKLIEDKANGPAIEDVLKKSVPGIVLVNPQGGKEARLHACSGLFEAGNVHIPHPDLYPWVLDYRRQMVTFPRAVNDDMVDQTSQALNRLVQRHVPFVEAMQAVRRSKK